MCPRTVQPLEPSERLFRGLERDRFKHVARSFVASLTSAPKASTPESCRPTARLSKKLSAYALHEVYGLYATVLGPIFLVIGRRWKDFSRVAVVPPEIPRPFLSPRNPYSSGCSTLCRDGVLSRERCICFDVQRSRKSS